MKKWLGLFLLLTTSAFASVDGLDKPFTRGELIGYDLHIEFDLNFPKVC